MSNGSRCYRVEVTMVVDVIVFDAGNEEQAHILAEEQLSLAQSDSIVETRAFEITRKQAEMETYHTDYVSREDE